MTNSTDLITPREESILKPIIDQIPRQREEFTSTEELATHLVNTLTSQGLKAYKILPFNDVYVRLESGAPLLVFFDQEGRRQQLGTPHPAWVNAKSIGRLRRKRIGKEGRRS